MSIPLQPGMRADSAVKVIGKQLLAAIHANTDGAQQGLDPEFLHDLRVAVRRTRAALAQFKGVFPEATTKRAKQEFRWLGQVTGPTRDYDVLLQKIDRYRRDLDEATNDDLDPLLAYLKSRQEHHQAALVRVLQSARFRDWLQWWATFLERPPPQRPRARHARRVIEEYAAARIWRLHKKILRDGGAITDATPDARVHELRLVAKKLRYLMEFARTLFPRKTIGAQIKTLKRLQDCLGDFNDLAVHREAMERAAAELGPEHAAAVAATQRLGASLRQRQAQVRADFQTVFAGYAEDTSRERARAMFAPQP